MVKKILLSLLIAVLSLSMIACKTPTGQPDVVRTQRVKDAIQPVVSSVVTRVVKQNPDLFNYFKSGGDLFCEMKEKKNFSPEYLIAQFDKIGSQYLRNSDATDAKNLIIALYKINYSDRFKADLPEGSFVEFLTDILCLSIRQGLKDVVIN